MNAWESVDWIASEALMHLEDALIITRLTAKDLTAEFNHTANGYAKGDSVSIKTNPEYEARDFDADNSETKPQGIRSSKRQLTIEKLFDVSVEMTAKEKRLNFEDYSSQVIMPAAYALAEKLDTYTGTKILQAAGLYASDGLFASAADMALARKAANIQQLNPAGRFCLVNSDLEAMLLGATYFSTYNNRGDEGAAVFREGDMGRAMKMDFFSSLQFPENQHTAGTIGTLLSNNSGATNGTKNNLIGSTTLPVDGGASVDIKAGDRIQVKGMRRPLIVASAFASASGDIPLVDPITEVVPDNAAITVIGAGQALETKGAIFDNNSIAVAMPMLDTPSDKPSFVAGNNGYSLRVVSGYDMKYKKEMMSLDCLIGAAAQDTRRITLLDEY